MHWVWDLLVLLDVSLPSLIIFKIFAYNLFFDYLQSNIRLCNWHLLCQHVIQHSYLTCWFDWSLYLDRPLSPYSQLWTAIHTGPAQQSAEPSPAAAAARWSAFAAAAATTRSAAAACKCAATPVPSGACTQLCCFCFTHQALIKVFFPCTLLSINRQCSSPSSSSSKSCSSSSRWWCIPCTSSRLHRPSMLLWWVLERLNLATGKTADTIQDTFDLSQCFWSATEFQSSFHPNLCQTHWGAAWGMTELHVSFDVSTDQFCSVSKPGSITLSTLNQSGAKQHQKQTLKLPAEPVQEFRKSVFTQLQNQTQTQVLQTCRKGGSIFSPLSTNCTPSAPLQRQSGLSNAIGRLKKSVNSPFPSMLHTDTWEGGSSIYTSSSQV